MKRRRLDRDVGWGFQGFPYYQARLDSGDFHGFASLIDLLAGETFCWAFDKAGDAPVSGAGMKWLQLVPDGQSRMITAMFLPGGRLSVCYVDVIERLEFDPDGVAAYVDKYLDVTFTPQGDVALLDRDELDEAYAGGELTRDQYDAAIREADGILAELCADVPATVAILEGLLRALLELIGSGELTPLRTKYQLS